MQNAVVARIVFLVVFNMVLSFFGTMGFFTGAMPGVQYDDDGKIVSYPAGYVFATTWGFVDVFLGAILIFLGAILGKIANVNGVKMVLFVEIFWMPYLKTLGLFTVILGVANITALLGLVTIFSTVMLFAFGKAIMEMTDTTNLSFG